jgi:hypothetical protein
VTPIYDSSTYNGKLYAIPGGADYFCMFYSKDVMRDADLDPEKPPATLEDLLLQSEHILKKDGNGDIQRIGYSPSAGHFVNWAFIHGGKFYDDANKKITANDPANVAVLERLATYMKVLDVNKLAAFNQRPGTFRGGERVLDQTGGLSSSRASGPTRRSTNTRRISITALPTGQPSRERPKSARTTRSAAGCIRSQLHPSIRRGLEIHPVHVYRRGSEDGRAYAQWTVCEESTPALGRRIKAGDGAAESHGALPEVFHRYRRGREQLLPNHSSAELLLRRAEPDLGPGHARRNNTAAGLDEVTKNVQTELGKVKS